MAQAISKLDEAAEEALLREAARVQGYSLGDAARRVQLKTNEKAFEPAVVGLHPLTNFYGAPVIRHTHAEMERISGACYFVARRDSPYNVSYMAEVHICDEMEAMLAGGRGDASMVEGLRREYFTAREAMKLKKEN